MKAIVSVWVGGGWLVEQLEALLFALAAGLVASGTFLLCLLAVPHWS